MPRSWPKRIALVLLAAFFVFAGVTHFTNPEFFIAIVPAWLPNAPLLVAVSGVAEIAGGIGVLIPRTRRLAGWGLIALLVAVYPANVDMALHPDEWLARVAHPDLFPEKTFTTTVKDAYKLIYQKDLTDDQVKRVLELEQNKDSAGYNDILG